MRKSFYVSSLKENFITIDEVVPQQGDDESFLQRYLVTNCCLHLHHNFHSLYNNNRPMFLALICFLCALIAIIPLVVSLSRQHRAAIGNRSVFLEYFEDEEPLRLTLSKRSRASSSSGTLSERTHLLTLKDMYADARKQEEKTKRPRGRSIVMTSPEHDPFHLVPSASFDGENSDKR